MEVQQISEEMRDSSIICCGETVYPCRGMNYGDFSYQIKHKQTISFKKDEEQKNEEQKNKIK